MAETLIGIIGAGHVGQAMLRLFPKAIVYDEPLNIGSKELVNTCKLAFVCVPTPNLPDGSLDMSIVDDVMSWCEADVVVIRSAVNPGTSDRLEAEGHNVVYQPEYIGEGVAPPFLDEAKTPFMVLGGRLENTRKVIETYQEVYNANIKIRQVTNLEAEVIKLSENRAILYKVAQAQELYDACERAGVDYYTVREAVYGDDPRFNLWWTFVYPDNRGANSKCIPKDVKAWAAWAKDSELTDALLKYNDGLINAPGI